MYITSPNNIILTSVLSHSIGVLITLHLARLHLYNRFKEARNRMPKPKFLIVLTSQDMIPTNRATTGWYLVPSLSLLPRLQPNPTQTTNFSK